MCTINMFNNITFTPFLGVLILSVIVFFAPVPFFIMTLPLVFGFFFARKFSKTETAKKLNKILRYAAICLVFGLVAFTSLGVYTLRYNETPEGKANLAKSADDKKVADNKKQEDEEKKQNDDKLKTIEQQSKQLDEEAGKRKQAEDKAQEEESKRKELEFNIARATTINTNYDVGSDLEAQGAVQLVQEANKSIANLGNSTKNQKLFDVLQVVDGDTIKVSELGTLRLIGIDTPETKDPRKVVQCFGKEASQNAHNQLDGKKVYLEFDPSNRIDKYNRTLAYVYRDDGYFYNLQAVKDGYAHSYVQYPHPKLDEFNQAQTEARDGQKGFWSPSSCNGDTTQPADKPQPTPEPVKQEPTPQPVIVNTPVKNNPTPAPVTNTNNGEKFIAGSCKELVARGIGNFPRGSINYKPERDRDNDGIACELK